MQAAAIFTTQTKIAQGDILKKDYEYWENTAYKILNLQETNQSGAVFFHSHSI